MLNINKFNYPFTLKQKSFLENFFKFAPPYIQTVLMLRSYKKDSRLVAAGDSCAHVYILLKGRLEAVEDPVWLGRRHGDGKRSPGTVSCRS